MQPVLRNCGRLTTRVVKRRAKTFHTACANRASERPPDESDHSRQYGLPTRRVEEGEAKNETEEHIEGRRAGLRRTLRQRRIHEPPTPPPLPEWYLKHAVQLRELVPPELAALGLEDERAVTLVDPTTGHVLFTTPWNEWLDTLIDHSTRNGANVESANPADHIEPSNHRTIPSMAWSPKRSKQEPLDAQRPHIPLDPRASALLELLTLARAILSQAGNSKSAFAAAKTGLSIEFIGDDRHDNNLKYVHTFLAPMLDADVIALKATDIAALTEDYVGQGNDLPGSFSTLAYDVFAGKRSPQLTRLARYRPSSTRPVEEEPEEDQDEDEEDAAIEAKDFLSPGKLSSMKDFIKSRLHGLDKIEGISAFSFDVPTGVMLGRKSNRSHKENNTSDFIQWDDARLTALLEQLLDAAKIKRSSESTISSKPYLKRMESESTLAWQAETMSNWRTNMQLALAGVMRTNRILDEDNMRGLSFREIQAKTTRLETNKPAATIILVEDLQDICSLKLGEAIMRRLSKVVQKRRKLGEAIMIVGVSSGIERRTVEEDDPFLQVVIPDEDYVPRLPVLPKSVLAQHGAFAYPHLARLNDHLLSDMIYKLGYTTQRELSMIESMEQLLIPGMDLFTESALTRDEVYRLVIGAIGLSQTYMKSEHIHPIHLSMSAVIMHEQQRTRLEQKIPERLRYKEEAPRSSSVDGEGKNGLRASRERMDAISSTCNSHEKRLLSGVVDVDSIKTGFKDVHVDPETIEALKTLTTLSLLRPDAFKYGVLANDSLTGLMLYGPPGTGKTLLAKAVAKESNAFVLEVTGAQIYEKYVGEGEKMVRAVFSLAKKLSASRPCVVFIDEADALFGSRNSSGNRNAHREVINQFLREWDGMSDHRVFMMVASNRPFDMDDAVLRRLPRRLLVDLPTQADRHKILTIHLRDEALDAGVSLDDLAERTPLYSGSDLKNMCVAAALAAVREENELVARHENEDSGVAYKLPEKRILSPRHFDKGLQEISASISEDMSSLTAIRKFDEQYGERRGRKKKASYGFGALGGAVDENAARVRQPTV